MLISSPVCQSVLELSSQMLILKVTNLLDNDLLKHFWHYFDLLFSHCCCTTNLHEELCIHLEVVTGATL